MTQYTMDKWRQKRSEGGVDDMFEIKVRKNNINEVLKELEENAERGLKAIGAEASGYAAKETPVDTGRLRNSITWVTEDEQGGANAFGEQKAKPEDYATKAKPEKMTLYVGTNVEYAQYQEYGDYHHTSGKKHFLRDSMSTHTARYKDILEASLKA